MGSFANTIEKRVTKQTSGVASSMLQRLNTLGAKNISIISFPSNLENQAQATYMVIYVLDNPSNQASFNSNIFASDVDETSYEIGFISELSDAAKEHVINPLTNWLKDTGNQIAKDAKDWLNKAKESLTPAKTDNTEQVQLSTWEEIKQFNNKWLLRKKTKKASDEFNDAFDPLSKSTRAGGWQLEKAIQIQMPSSSLRYKYDNGWESTDTSTLNTIKTLMSGLTNMFGDKSSRKTGSSQISEVLDRIGNSIGDALSGGGYTAEKQSKSGVVYNPVLVFNYTVPRPREFTYSFSLYPRNKEELYNLYNIIQLLKFYSLPEVNEYHNAKKTKDDGTIVDKKENGKTVKTQNPMTFRYPAKFAIKFYTNGYENKWFPKTSMLGLTSIEETLTGDGGDMAYFENYFDKGSGNPPRMIRLTLSFKELAILDRNAANAGY